MSEINYAIELDSGCTGVTDLSYGCATGVFRYVTGRPGYVGDTGSQLFPTFETGTDNTYAWYESWISKDGLGNASRRVNIDISGDYGNLSGFNFSVRNTTKLWDFINDNSVFIINRPIKLYTIIDDVFYEIWNGVISRTSYDETKFTFECVDKFKTIHKELPPDIINEASYPNADRESLGRPVPIVLGQVAYAPALKISNVTVSRPLIKWGGSTFYAAQCRGYATVPTIRIYLVTAGVTFSTNELQGDYLVSVSGEDANKDKLIRILGNTATRTISGVSQTLLTLAEPLDGVSATTFNSDYAHKDGFPDSTDWYFKVINFNVEAIASSGSIIGYKTDATQNIEFFRWNEETGRYESIKDLVLAESTSGTTTSLKIRANSITEDGQVQVLAPISFTGVNMPAALTDKDRTTSVSYLQTIPQAVRTYGIEYVIEPDPTYDYTAHNAIYLCIDEEYYYAIETSTFTVGCMWRVFDPYGKIYKDILVERDLFEGATFNDPATTVNLIPNDYYLLGDDNDESSDFATLTDLSGETESRSLLLRMPDEIKSLLEDGVVTRLLIKPYYYMADGSVTNLTRRVKQVAFFALKTLPTIEGQLYVHVDGEEYSSGIPADDVYNVYRHILENYDGISTSDIDYGNLATTRADWQVSRVLTSRQSSYDYLASLARQSFTCIVPTREGKRKLTAWRENETSAADFTSADIVRDSINVYEKTQISLLFNTFFLEYHWNYATGKFDRAVSINYIDQDEFPAVTNSDWTKYVSGLSQNSYGTAKALWDICHDAYEYYRAIQRNDDVLGKLYWYADPNVYTNGVASPGASTAYSVYKFLENLVEWTTRQKENAEFRIPLSSTNLQRELLDYITFTDTIYTNGDARGGWITLIEYDLKQHQIKLRATLNPIDIEEDAVIVERGALLNTDTITERGDQGDDTITET